MKLAMEVLEALQSVIVGDSHLTPPSINQSFLDILQGAGYDDVKVQSHIDLDDGVYVKFTQGAEDVVVLFTLHDYPRALVVSDDDDQIDIDLRPLSPTIIKLGAFDVMDLSDMSWMNRSVISALMNAGKITEEEDVFVVSGNKTIRLPIIKRSSTPSDFCLRCREKVKTIEWQ